MKYKNLTGLEPVGTIGYVDNKLCIIETTVGVAEPCKECVTCFEKCVVLVKCTPQEGSVDEIYFKKYKEVVNV